MSTRPCDPDDIDAEFKEVQDRIAELEAKASNADVEEQKKAFTGIVFIVLDSPDEVAQVLKH